MAEFDEQIESLQEEIRKTPYHKGTEHHIGLLRARIARLKDKQLESYERSSGKKGSGSGYAIKKQGDATVVLVGPPSVGKSTLINRLTNANSKIAPYEFTTLKVIPGMMIYKDAKIQILDVPGLIEGAHEGKGKGKEVLSVIRGSDLIIILTEPDKLSAYDTILETLEKNGIRVNKRKPYIKIDKKLSGGINIFSNIKLNISKDTIKNVAIEMGTKNCDITIKEILTLDNIIDSFSKNRIYIPAIFVLNKSDLFKSENSDYFKGLTAAGIIPLSAKNDESMDKVKEKIWDALLLMRIYLVKKDELPTNKNPMIVKKGTILKDVALKIGEGFLEKIKYAQIWGDGAKFPGQEVSLSTEAKENMIIKFL